MKTIKVTTSFSTGLDVSFDKDISSINIEDDHFGEGGFGLVYRVERIDKRKSSLPLVVKILRQGKERNFETIVRLQRLVREEAKNLREQSILFFDKYPSLLALPLLSFEGTFEGKTVYGYLSINLEKLGFVPASYIFLDCLEQNKPEVWAKFQYRHLSVKYKMAYYLAVSCSFLRRIHFIHADITPDNLFIHPYEPLCVLIDFDSGAIIDSKLDFPTTEGKHYADWTPPEMVVDSSEKRLTAAVDDWAFTIALHYIFTGYQAFFTKNMSPNTIKLLDEMYRDGSTIWPDINDIPKYTILFNEKNLQALPYYREYYDRLDERVKRGFEYTFSHGALRLAYRHDAKWWIPVLEKCVQDSPLKVNVTWRSLKECQQQFPDIQSKKEAAVPPVWVNKMHFSQDHISMSTSSTISPQKEQISLQEFHGFMQSLVPDLIRGRVSLLTHCPMIEKFANNAGLNGKEIIRNLKDLLDMYQEMKSRKAKGEELSKTDKSKFRCQASLIHVDITSIINSM